MRGMKYMAEGLIANLPSSGVNCGPLLWGEGQESSHHVTQPGLGGTHYVAQAALEFLILLTEPSEC